MAPSYLEKRYCSEWDAANGYCGGWWYSEKGYITKWAILGSLFGFFMLWFVGGYFHAKSRLKKGKRLLGYHRWLVSRSERARYGQAPPQNHFTFYHIQRHPYPSNQPYAPRTDGAYPEPPPLYNGSDAPPSYYAPPPQGAPKTYAQPMYAMGPQQTGVVTEASPGASGSGNANANAAVGTADGQSQGQAPAPADLPPRPEQARVALSKFVGRFRR